MTTFTAHDKDIPNVPGITPEQAETVLPRLPMARRHRRERPATHEAN